MAQYTVEEIDISEFIPTQRQLLAKAKLHQFVPSNIIGGLTPETISKIRGYLFPITVEEILKWHFDCKVFWFWFVLENEQVTKLNAMKGAAVGVIRDILQGDVADSKLAGVQLKAASMLLNLSDKPSSSITKNTMNISSSSSDLPKALKKKSTVELQEELKRIEAQITPED